jgi:hypothetical protein
VPGGLGTTASLPGVRSHLAVTTATLTSGLLALVLPLGAHADQPRPVAHAVDAPSVTTPKAATSTTVGQTGAGAGCGPLSLATIQTATAGSPAYTTPAGVITSFSYQGSATPGQVQAVLYGPETSPGDRTLVAKSAKALSAANVLNTFPTRVPVTAGLTLGVWTQSGMSCTFPAAVGDQVQSALVDPDVSPAFASIGGSPSARVNVSAVVESDADGDGYGDVTQDLCPQSKLTRAACPAPDTTVTKAPKKKSTKRKATIAFTSGVGGSTFTCAVDKKAAGPCTSPFKKKYKVGKHQVVITATSPAGIVDPTPVTVKFKVTKPS